MAIDRRTFLQVTTAGIAAAGEAARANFGFADAVPKTSAILKFETSPDHASIRFLSWDTEGGDRAQRNLLRSGPGITLRVKIGEAGEHWPVGTKEHGFYQSVLADLLIEEGRVVEALAVASNTLARDVLHCRDSPGPQRVQIIAGMLTNDSELVERGFASVRGLALLPSSASPT